MEESPKNQKPRRSLMPKRYLHGPEITMPGKSEYFFVVLWHVVSWRTRRLSNSTKYLLHASMTTTSKKKKWNLLENCHKYALKLFWNACTWHVLGDPILWSVNKLARSITKWTKACDKRLARLISFIRTCEHRQNWHAGNTAQFQASDFERDLEDSKWMLEGVLCIFGSHTFVPLSWICKKKTSVSHSSEARRNLSACESRFQPRTPISIWPTLITFHQTWNLLVQVLCYMSLRTMKLWLRKSKTGVPQWDTLQEPTELLLDWLFDRINLDPKIQIKYVDTKNKLADILTKWNFTRDEWNNLLHLFNISHFSSTCCAENSSLISCPKTMAKRMQEQKDEDKIVELDFN